MSKHGTETNFDEEQYEAERLVEKALMSSKEAKAAVKMVKKDMKAQKVKTRARVIKSVRKK